MKWSLYMKDKGMLRTMYGELPFGYGDYFVIPRGTIYQIDLQIHITVYLLWIVQPDTFPKNTE